MSTPTRRIDLDPAADSLPVGRRIDKDERRTQANGPRETVYVSAPQIVKTRLGLRPRSLARVEVRERAVVIVPLDRVERRQR